MASRDVVIAGAGGMGREALAWCRDAHPDLEIVGFVDDEAEGNVAGLPVLGPLAHVADRDLHGVVVGIGSATGRRRLLEIVDEAGVDLLTVVHPSAVLGPDVVLKRGAVVGPNVTITRDADVGEATIVNFGAQIGHDASIGACAFIGPGAALGGNVTVGDDAWVGIGATVLQRVTIGAGAVVGAGATVIRDVAPGTTVVGTPARPMPS